MLLWIAARAQSDTLSRDQAPDPAYRQAAVDSAELRLNQLKLDSLRLSDSLATAWIKAPDPARPNRFVDSLINLYSVKNFNFEAWAKQFPQKSSRFNQGIQRTMGETWVILVILTLLLFFAVLRNAFSKELGAIVQSFYSSRSLSQINKEENLLSSWPFLLLFLLFGLTIGMFLYLSGKYFQLEYNYKGFEWFLVLSAVIIALFALKIVVLRILGFFFGVQKLVKEYVTILYLSYFNAALIFLPLVIAFSLTPERYAGIYTYLAILLIILVFIIQFLRAGNNVLSNYHFSKFYLIIYLCALEICPVLILIKALRF
ncbi:DUF4271 domain-containing protein [Flavihumibacter sp. R14]|nr:DUF4271 domain-containing protein [Flavihumibacter soli]